MQSTDRIVEESKIASYQSIKNSENTSPRGKMRNPFVKLMQTKKDRGLDSARKQASTSDSDEHSDHVTFDDENTIVMKVRKRRLLYLHNLDFS